MQLCSSLSRRFHGSHGLKRHKKLGVLCEKLRDLGVKILKIVFQNPR